jgi:hypothetical protein
MYKPAINAFAVQCQLKAHNTTYKSWNVQKMFGNWAKLYQELSIRNDRDLDLFMAQAQQLSKLADNDGGIL